MHLGLHARFEVDCILFPITACNFHIFARSTSETNVKLS